MSGTGPIYLYRFTSLGESLKETLDHFVSNKQIDQELSEAFLECFESKFLKVVSEKATKSCTLKGHLNTYKHLPDVWRLWIENAKIATETEAISSRMLNIVAVNAKKVKDPLKIEDDSDKPRKKRKISKSGF